MVFRGVPVDKPSPVELLKFPSVIRVSRRSSADFGGDEFRLLTGNQFASAFPVGSKKVASENLIRLSSKRTSRKTGGQLPTEPLLRLFMGRVDLRRGHVLAADTRLGTCVDYVQAFIGLIRTRPAPLAFRTLCSCVDRVDGSAVGEGVLLAGTRIREDGAPVGPGSADRLRCIRSSVCLSPSTG